MALFTCLIEQAVEADLLILLEAYACDKTDDGRAPLVCYCYLPEREVITGIGAVPDKVPRVRDRGKEVEKVRFMSTILPPQSTQIQTHRRNGAMALSQTLPSR